MQFRRQHTACEACRVAQCRSSASGFGTGDIHALKKRRWPRSARSVAWAVIGASTVRVAVYVPMIASALGLGVQLSASARLFTAVKIIGAACLVWLGRFAAAFAATRLHWHKRAFGGMILFGIPILFTDRASSGTA